MERLYVLKEAADYLGIKPATLREWLRTGKVKGSKVGRQWRLRESDLEAICHDR